MGKPTKMISPTCVVVGATTKLKPTSVSPTTATHATTMLSVILAIGMIHSGTEAAIESTNLQYTEYWYRTEQLCPDLQEAITGKDIDTANYPYKSVFRFMDHLQSVSEPYADLPCILEANGPKRLVSTALIEGIHVDSRQWNYTGAETCEEHIKLRLPEPTFLKRSNVPKIICRIPKSRNHGLKDATGSLYHPYVWQFQKGKLGLSFSSFNLSHLVRQQFKSLPGANLMNTSEDSPNDQNISTNYWQKPDSEGRKFVQVVFTTHFGGKCSLRVQQYLVDSEKTLCGDIQTRSPFRLCGLYDCSEKENILRTLGFWTHRKAHEQMDILLQSNLPRWRREEASYLEILLSTLRALIMPLLFLSVFYVTRRLRLKLANRHHPNRGGSHGGSDRHGSVLRHRQCYLRGLIREGGINNSSGSSDSSGSAEHMLRPSLILNHVVYDIPVNSVEFPVYEDLPPPYESIVQPPSYQVATTQVKQASSPCPVVLEGGLSITANITSPPTPSGDGGDCPNVNNSVVSPANNSTPAPVISAASQPTSGSRLSFLDDDVVFQTPPETRPSTNANSSSETPSSPPPVATTTTQHYPSV